MEKDQNTRRLDVGLKRTASMVVETRHSVPHIEPAWPGFVDMPTVFATAMMVGFVEQTCVEALRPFLRIDQRTVGIHVDVSHIAATPVGMTVTADVELIEITDASLCFRVSCRDQAGIIGEGLHRRAIIDIARFNARVAKKAADFIS